jgi:biotin carboxyl carrier protein
MKKGTSIVAGERVEFEWKAEAEVIQATVGGRTYSLEAKEVQRGVYWFSWNGRSIEAAVIETDDGYSVSILGERIPVEFLDARKSLRRAAHGDHDGVAELRAPMPGKIVRILVSEGAEVEAQQGIVVMEAMKMQNEIRSPKRGKIRKLEVKEGDTVNGAALIAQVE